MFFAELNHSLMVQLQNIFRNIRSRLSTDGEKTVICAGAVENITYNILFDVVDHMKSIIEAMSTIPYVIAIKLNPSPLVIAIMIAVIECRKPFCFIGDNTIDLLSQYGDVIVVTEFSDLLNKQNSKFGMFSTFEVVSGAKEKISLPILNSLDISYITFTSGSTGESKPVFVSEGSIIPNISDFVSLWNISSCDSIALLSPLSFDPSIVEIFCALFVLAKLVIIPTKDKLDAEALCVDLVDGACSIVQMTPSLFSNFSGSQLKKLLLDVKSQVRVIILGGEKFPFSDRSQIPTNLKSWLVQDPINHKLVNVYGLSEISCWATYSIFDIENNEFADIGKPLSETVVTPVIPLDSSTNSNIREIAIGSSTRICYVGDEIYSFSNRSIPYFRRTGDLVLPLKSGGFQFSGRFGNIIKRYGRKLAVDTVLKKFRTHFWNKVSNAFLTTRKGSNCLVLIVFITYPCAISTLEVRDWIRLNFGSLYQPDEVLISSQSIPLSKHGKADIDIILRSINTRENDNQDLTSELRNLWHTFTGVNPALSSQFVNDGGDSMAVILLSSTMNKIAAHKKLTKLPELLLSKTFKDIVDYLTNVAMVDKLRIQKTSKRNLGISCHMEKLKFGMITRSNNVQNVNNFVPPTQMNQSDKLTLKLSWRTNMEKCIDGSPVVVTFDNESKLVFVASHSGLVCCFIALSGEEKWRFKLNSRIEASVALSPCGHFLIIGSYNNKITILYAESGRLAGEIDTGDAVKCTPTTNTISNSVFVGCHDGSIYKIGFDSEITWESVNLNCGAISASPVVTGGHVLVATLRVSKDSINL